MGKKKKSTKKQRGKRAKKRPGKKARTRTVAVRVRPVRPRLALGEFQLDDKSACPCGSGNSYSECCKPWMDGSLSDAARLLKAGDFASAERQYRAEFVRYLGLVHEHTVPMRQVSPDAAAQIVQIDLDALQECADAIANCLWEEGRQVEILPLFDHLSTTVPLPEYKERVIYLRAAWLYIRFGQRDRAKAELERMGDILATTHSETIELWLDVFDQEPSIAQAIKMCDRILSISDDPARWLQYGAMKSLYLELLGENEAARDAVQEAISRFEATPDSTLDLIGKLMCGRAYFMRWRLGQSEADFRAALRWIEQVPKAEFKPEGRASLLYEIADWHARHGDFRKAIDLLQESLEVAQFDPALIHLAEAYLEDGENDKARAALGRLSFDSIEPGLRLEFLGAEAALALATGDVDIARRVVDRLADLKLRDLYFQRTRDQLRLQVHEFLASPKAVRGRENRALQLLRRMLRCVELKPNFMGIGFDLNRLIGSAAKDKGPRSPSGRGESP